MADTAACESAGLQASAPYAPTPRQNDPNTIEPFWRAEIGRRRAEFMGKLNAAARSGDLRFRGRPVKKTRITQSSKSKSVPGKIHIACFVEDRGFNEYDSCIEALGESASELEHEAALAGRSVSYRDVVVERASFLSFLKSHYPAVLNANLAREKLTLHEDTKRLTQALPENKDVTKADAAALVGRDVRSARFSNKIWPEARENAGLPRLAPAGRKKKVGSSEPKPESA